MNIYDIIKKMMELLISETSAVTTNSA